MSLQDLALIDERMSERIPKHENDGRKRILNSSHPDAYDMLYHSKLRPVLATNPEFANDLFVAAEGYLDDPKIVDFVKATRGYTSMERVANTYANRDIIISENEIIKAAIVQEIIFQMKKLTELEKTKRVTIEQKEKTKRTLINASKDKYISDNHYKGMQAIAGAVVQMANSHKAGKAMSALADMVVGMVGSGMTNGTANIRNRQTGEEWAANFSGGFFR